MTRYFFQGLIEGGQTATILTQDGRFGELDLVHYVLKFADPDLDNPTDAQIERAARLAAPPTRNQFYFPFGRDIAESTARIDESVTVTGEPQPFVLLSPANRHKAENVRKKIFNMAQWWRTAGQPSSLLHISLGLDKRFAGGLLTFASYQSQWREITKVNGKTPRNVSHQLSEQKRLWTDLLKQMRADPTNTQRYLILPAPGEGMQVVEPIAGQEFLDHDPALYTTPVIRHEQYLKWLKLGQQAQS
ncbi:hypothetical protein [Lacticaseibacillus camelliae]|uniref:Uncharacterized protein n=1 Tax=Lacticaseibacillus camelliae DSM 22697 = JCM 13995 TaxID=1423730 RepID=A0A0R2FAM6_9LACO|nr:hypothetical protein [Lacticaseibacillus camelliae]KRN25409.1 hypothetical protein FC75_GL000433 [Lacticaseibacillus camelliae DSM 22697 = JCM 13995]